MQGFPYTIHVLRRVGDQSARVTGVGVHRLCQFKVITAKQNIKAYKVIQLLLKFFIMSSGSKYSEAWFLSLPLPLLLYTFMSH